jgi:3-oxoacyl-[acyl-carrier-protein] synthase II
MTARHEIAVTGTGAAPSDAPLPEPVRARAVRTERVTQLALGAAGTALAAAGLAATDGAPHPRRGIVLGTGFGCFATNAAFQRGFAARGTAGASPRAFAATVSNAATGEVGIAYRLGGPAVTLTAGTAAGSTAIGHAMDLLRAGRADALVAGGVDAVDDALAAWLAGGGLAVGAPAEEAATAVVLERRDDALARGARVAGTLLGHADGFEPQPDGPRAGEGLAAAIEAACAEADVVAGAVARVVVVAPPALRDAVAAGLAPAFHGTLRSAAPAAARLAAGGPAALVAALGEAPAGTVVLVVDACASGHVAAVVARAAEGRPA